MSPVSDPTAVPGPPIFRHVAIVGCGLIGGSVALAARARWPSTRLTAVDRRPVLEAAAAAGAIDGGGEDLAAGLAGADLVVLAAPVAANIDALPRLAAAITGGAVVTDVGGTKRAIVDAAAALPERLAFVGGHPLAGAARGGVEQARADLFHDRPWILTPATSTPHDAVEALERFVAGLGARPRRLAPEAHDRLLAYLSHLPQLTVSALMHVVGERAGVDGLTLAGPGLRDTTRLAASPASIWRDVVATNRDHLGGALDGLIATLEQLRGAGTATIGLDAVFASAERWRAVLERGTTGSTAVRTYLEMRSRASLRPAPPAGDGWRIAPLPECPPSFYRYLYGEVGRRYHWVDRAGWSDGTIAAHLANPDVSIWLLTVNGAPAGFFELKRDDDGGVEIAYLGLLDAFTGRGMGGYLVSEAAARAWDLGAGRVWLHTCSLDHPAALPNYQKRGFTPFRTEEYSL